MRRNVPIVCPSSPYSAGWSSYHAESPIQVIYPVILISIPNKYISWNTTLLCHFPRLRLTCSLVDIALPTKLYFSVCPSPCRTIEFHDPPLLSSLASPDPITHRRFVPSNPYQLLALCPTTLPCTYIEALAHNLVMVHTSRHCPSPLRPTSLPPPSLPLRWYVLPFLLVTHRSCVVRTFTYLTFR